MTAYAYFKLAGHCTRCHAEFSAEAAAFMVRENVVWQTLGEGEFSVAISNQETVPVCEPCTTVKEQAADRTEITCGGCGQRMLVGRDWRTRHCSDRCAQRVRRKIRRFKNATCAVCKTAFKPARSDAKFCSSQCRQWSYRLRRSVGTLAQGDEAP